MKIECDNVDNGCKWIDELRLLGDHLTACDYTFLSCPNECEDGDKILRKDMEKHTTEECPRRQHVCPNCSESGEYVERTTTHLEECPRKKIPCSNDGCCKHVARCHLLLHYDMCEFQKVPCKYATLGCEVEVLRKDLEKHESDREKHLYLAMNAVPGLQQKSIKQQETIEETVKQQKNTLARLQTIILAQNKEISELKLKLERQPCVPLYDPLNDRGIPFYSQPPTLNQPPISDQSVFKFTDYAARKSRNASVFSPPIYSSPGGYKMCINVLPNGDWKGKGTHVSVYAYLMHGENDDHLAWPFTGTVVIELLNQLTNQNHFSVRIKMSKDRDVSKRVLEGDRAKTGWGRPLYISHSSLNHNAAKNCQYLKDDCLYFRLRIDSSVSPKPWLSSADLF